MRVFKIACIILCMLSMLSVVTGYRSDIVLTAQTRGVEYDAFIRPYLLVNAIIFGFTFYYVNKRKPLGWKLGWIFWGILFVDYIILALARAQAMPQSKFWFAIIAQGTLGFLLMFYWCAWWKRQKYYFN